MIQTLEARRLLSASFQFVPETATLWVMGTDNPDQIEVSVGSKPLCTVNGPVFEKITPLTRIGSYVNVFEKNVLVYQTFIPGTGLQNVNVMSGDGDDVLLACNLESSVTIRVFADSGADQINAVHFGLTAATEVYGGEGNDLIQVHASIGAQSGFIVWGESGNDLIYGSSLNDVLLGDADPTLERPNSIGDDVIYAGAGDDYLHGGDGDDALYGQEGDDVLDGFRGSDMLDGGAGEDVGICDEFDKMIVDIEKLVEFS